MTLSRFTRSAILGASLAVGTGPAIAQFQELPVEMGVSAEAEYSWSVRVTDEGIVLAGDVPYLSVKQGLMSRAGGNAIDQMAVTDGAPLGFLIDATKAVEASALLSEGGVAYSDGAWTVSGTLRTDSDRAALNEVLGEKTMTGEPWLVELEDGRDESATMPADADEPKELEAVRPVEPNDANDSASGAEAEIEISEPTEPQPATPAGTADDSAAETTQQAAAELADRADGAGQDAEEQKAPGEKVAASMEEATDNSTDEVLPEQDTTDLALPTEADQVPTTEPETAPVAEPVPMTASEAGPTAEFKPIPPIDLCREQVESYMANRSILFGSGSARLRAESKTDLAGLAEIFAICPSAPVYVEGHTDTDGRPEDNLILSLSRAEAVVDALMELGIDPARLYAVGYGAGLPIASNETSAGKAQNRRIVFSFEDIAEPGEGDEL